MADGSDVEDGEVEEVDSDAEDEVDREEDQMQLLLKMKNLRNKISKMEDQKEEVEDSTKAISPPPGISGRGGRGRGPRGRGRGKGRGKTRRRSTRGERRPPATNIEKGSAILASPEGESSLFRTYGPALCITPLRNKE